MRKTEKTLKHFLIFLTFLAVVIIIGVTFRIDEAKINALFEKFPIGYAALVFFLLYTLGTFIFWTLKEPLKVIGAILFGAYFSSLLIYFAELVNGVVFFKLSRLLGRNFVEKKVGGGFRKFYEKLRDLPLIKVMLLRANPLIPYRIFDVGLGLSKISFKKFLLAVLVASPIRVFWLQFPLAAMRGFSVEKMLVYFEQNMAVTLTMMVYIVIVCLAPFLIKERPAKEG